MVSGQQLYLGWTLFSACVWAPHIPLVTIRLASIVYLWLANMYAETVSILHYSAVHAKKVHFACLLYVYICICIYMTCFYLVYLWYHLQVPLVLVCLNYCLPDGYLVKAIATRMFYRVTLYRISTSSTKKSRIPIRDCPNNTEPYSSRHRRN